ncbi:MAG: hypothetical protein JXR13_13250 [Thalassovita sp.]
MNVEIETRGPLIADVQTFHLKIPGRRSHAHAGAVSRSQSILILKVTSDAGHEGYGEVATAGGPWWSGDSIESVQTIVTAHLRPVLLGQPVMSLAALMARMDRAAFGNPFAKAGLEMALLDMQGKILDVPVATLLGGIVRDSFAMCWPLGSVDVALDVEIAQDKQAQGIGAFKVKMGALPVDQDMTRALALAKALPAGTDLRIDLNAAWDERTARRQFPALAEAGYRTIEQPLPRDQLANHARLAQASPMALMADESLTDLPSLLAIAQTGAFTALSLKPMKSGGLTATRDLARVAQSLGLSLYGGCFLETSLGTAANLHLGAVLGDLALGCEWMGRWWLCDDIADNCVTMQDGQIRLPTGAGLGVKVDHEKIRQFAVPRGG